MNKRSLINWAAGKKSTIGISVAERFAKFSVMGATRSIPRTRKNRQAVRRMRSQLVYTGKSAKPIVIVRKGKKEDEDESANVPKNAILVFDCIMTTKARDRDGDVLDPEGAKIDEKMPLLWQHLPFEPIGVLVKVISQDKHGIKARFAILDTKLGRDAAKMVEAGAVRISHGFVPQKIEPLYDEEYEGDGQPPITGFQIDEYDVLECSLVSIPANPEAEILEHERVKFHHPLVKSFISTIRTRKGSTMKQEAKPASTAAPVSVNVNLSGLADLLVKEPDKGKEAVHVKSKDSEKKGSKEDEQSEIDKLYDVIQRAMDEEDPEEKNEILEEARDMCRSIKEQMEQERKEDEEEKSRKEDEEEEEYEDEDEDEDEDEEKSGRVSKEDEEDEDDDEDEDEDEDGEGKQAEGEDDVEPGDSEGRADEEDEDEDEDEKRHRPVGKKKKRSVLDDIFDEELRKAKQKKRR